ncbi:MAG: tRNA lysidine(34) synthetase TilS [Balneolaceae bacterium]
MSKSESIPFEESLKNSIQKVFKLQPTFIMGVSGGPDSMALLYAAHKTGVKIVAVHVNYGLRGEDSDLDQELCEGMCFEWGFECCSIRLDSRKESGENLQKWAREQRYQVFRDLKKEYNADGIITAHHQDDQVETILQKIFRGSGPEAWQGLKMWDGELFRPMLGYSKQEVLAYCEENSVPYRIDKSNLESKYARNFLRNDFFNELNSFFPGWKDNVLGLSEKGLIAEQAISELLKSIESNDGISISALNSYPKALRVSLIKKYLESNISDFSISKGMLNQIEELTQSDTGKVFEIKPALKLVRDRDHLVLKEDQSNSSSIVIGKKELGEGKFFFHFNMKLKMSAGSDSQLYLDAQKMEWPLTLRTWQNGDKIVPFGMTGTQKVSDHLTNRKIPSSKREKALILSGVDSTIYAIIFPTAQLDGQWGTISNLVKCTEGTEEYLTLNF